MQAENGSAKVHVLLVEDEYLIAEALQLNLEMLGVRVVGPVARVSDALDLLASDQTVDCSLLDVRLDGEPVFPVADALRERGIRFAFLSGYDRAALPQAYADAQHFGKLEDPNVLARWVKG